MTTGRALDREARAAHALEVQCADGELAGTARVHVTVLDVNEHAPAFAQRYYELRVPEPERDQPRLGDLPEVRPTPSPPVPPHCTYCI